LRAAFRGQSSFVQEASGYRGPSNPVLRYLAILSAARDFGVDRRDIERIAGQFDPLDARPEELADALADTIADRFRRA
jgi:hypothetical protein